MDAIEVDTALFTPSVLTLILKIEDNGNTFFDLYTLTVILSNPPPPTPPPSPFGSTSIYSSLSNSGPPSF